MLARSRSFRLTVSARTLRRFGWPQRGSLGANCRRCVWRGFGVKRCACTRRRSLWFEELLSDKLSRAQLRARLVALEIVENLVNSISLGLLLYLSLRMVKVVRAP